MRPYLGTMVEAELKRRSGGAVVQVKPEAPADEQALATLPKSGR